MRVLFAALLALLPMAANASDTRIETVITSQILPGYTRLEQATLDLVDTAASHCDVTPSRIETAFQSAFDAWMDVSHFRFGPSEENERAFALAFWPDSKGFTPKALNSLLNGMPEKVSNPAKFAKTSIAGRGFYALEYLLYDPSMVALGSTEQRCTLTVAISRDIHRNASEIRRNWESFQQELRHPQADGTYRSDKEVLQELYKSLSTGLEFTSDVRLGRPLGSFDRPRPKRAEAWRSNRSLRHVELSLVALEQLALALSQNSPRLTDQLKNAFERARDRSATFGDPSFASVTDPQDRLKLEIVKQSIDHIRSLVTVELGPALGVSSGFNALDGD